MNSGTSPGRTQSPRTGAVSPPGQRPPQRPWPLYVVAVLLAGLAALVLWAPVRHGDRVGPTEMVTAALFALLALGVLLLRRFGWWCATVAFAVLLVVQVSAEIAHPKTGNLVGCGYHLVGFGLLQLPAVHRYRRWRVARPDEPEDGAPGLAPTASEPAPTGWTREWLGGWVKLIGIVLFAALCLLVGVAMVGATLRSDDGASVGGGLAVALFGITMLATAPLFWPRRRARPRLGPVQLPHGAVQALLFPYSRLRSMAGLVGCLGFTALGVVLAIAPDPSGTRHTAGWLRVLGVVCALVFGAFAVLALRRGGRRALLFASPEVLGTHNAATGGVVPWSKVRAIEAAETTTYVRGMAVHEPHIAVMVDDRAAIEADRVDRAMSKLNRHFASGDLTFPVRALAVDPALVLAALRFYLQNPTARPELADPRALERVRVLRSTNAP